MKVANSCSKVRYAHEYFFSGQTSNSLDLDQDLVRITTLGVMRPLQELRKVYTAYWWFYRPSCACSWPMSEYDLLFANSCLFIVSHE